MFSPFSLRDAHTLLDTEKENNADPDDGNSWLCSACTLPIFSTPFKSTTTNDGHQLFQHDECVNLPEELTGHVLHRQRPLILKENQITSTTDSSNSCDNCKRKCGIVIYQCPGIGCELKIDVLCALQIKILHRSHQHRLMAIRSTLGSLITCGICATQHRSGRHETSGLLYSCHLCDFWIHPDCASLPNAIILHAQHQHSLFLTYTLPSHEIFAGSLKQSYTCAICGGSVKGVGVYFCAKCRYYAHIDCAIMSDPQSYEPVLIQDAKLAGLLRFPMADEFTSVMRYIMENSTTSSSSRQIDVEDEHECQGEGKLYRENLHRHPLILFHDQDGSDHPGQSSRVCDACVQPISAPFFSCPECPNFYLHSSCANLPSKIQHPAHKEHTLFLFPKAPTSSIFGHFFCDGCRRYNNRYVYSCETCNFNIDVVCALLPPSITHESHEKTHILYMSHEDKLFDYCNSCDYPLGAVFYECTICRYFKLDAKCVLFPNTVLHKFDEHLLKLTTKSEKSAAIDDDDYDDDRTVSSKKVQQICEICEQDMELWKWYYSCGQCDQSFHYDCIPSLNNISGFKFGVTIHVGCHDCPLTLIPERAVYDCRCGYCREYFFNTNEGLAYGCSKCNFSIHERCAEECLLERELRL